MNKILAIALNELKIQLRQPATLVFMLLVPAALIFAVALANGATFGDDANAPAPVLRITVDILDLDQSATSDTLIQAIRGVNPALVLCPMDAGMIAGDETVSCRLGDDAILTDGMAQVRAVDGVSAGYLVIPQGFGQGLQNAAAQVLMFRASDALEASSSAAYTAIQAAANRVAGAAVANRVGRQIDADLFSSRGDYAAQVEAESAALWASNPVRIDYTETAPDAAGSGTPTEPGFQQSVPGMGTMYVLFTVMAGVSILVQERKSWTLQRIGTMPVTASQVIMGKMLARITLGMIQFAFAFAIGLGFGAIFGVSFGNSIPALILVMLAFTFCISALTLLLATFIQNDSQAGSISTLVALTLAPIGGAWWSLENEFIPEIMRTIAQVSPVYWAMDGFSAVIRRGGGIAEVLLPVGVLLAIGAVLFALATRRFRIV
jgi:ABC-2 type transport system permease protein